MSNRVRIELTQRNALLLIVLVLCSSCATLPLEFQDAPPHQSAAVVFDIDGTLTPTPFQFWRVRSDAAETAQYYADQGVEIIYLTARTSLLQWHIPGWLERNDFPPGSLFTIQTNADRDDHEQFKTRILQQLIARGWNIELAFGDSSTDFQSYANVGISRLRVFALRRHGDDGCQPGIWARCLTGWSEYLQSPISLAR